MGEFSRKGAKEKMKIINKKNGRTIAKGRFELSKVSEVDIDTKVGANTWIFFRYFCDTLAKKKYDFNILYITVEITAIDNRITIEASNECEYEGVQSVVHLDSQEIELLASYIINYLLNKMGVVSRSRSPMI